MHFECASLSRANAKSKPKRFSLLVAFLTICKIDSKMSRWMQMSASHRACRVSKSFQHRNSFSAVSCRVLNFVSERNAIPCLFSFCLRFCFVLTIAHFMSFASVKRWFEGRSDNSRLRALVTGGNWPNLCERQTERLASSNECIFLFLFFASLFVVSILLRFPFKSSVIPVFAFLLFYSFSLFSLLTTFYPALFINRWFMVESFAHLSASKPIQFRF